MTRGNLMKAQKFEYHYKDVPLLKKDIAVRFVFTLLFFAVFMWQFISMLVVYTNDTLDSLMILSSVTVMISSLMFAVVAFVYLFRSVNIITDIKKRGKAVRFVSVLSSSKSGSFIKLYSILTKIIALCMIVILSCAVTYSILELIHYSTMSYYLPALIMLSLCGFNSVYHITNEITRLRSVEEYNSVY